MSFGSERAKRRSMAEYHLQKMNPKDPEQPLGCCRQWKPLPLGIPAVLWGCSSHRNRRGNSMSGQMYLLGLPLNYYPCGPSCCVPECVQTFMFKREQDAVRCVDEQKFKEERHWPGQGSGESRVQLASLPICLSCTWSLTADWSVETGCGSSH